jgi:hypothetical protein
MIPGNYSAVAYNPATESANQIHSDEMAKAYGFRGGLVPGVVISGYLMEPAIQAWGEAWLKQGEAHVKVLKPVYDGLDFSVEVSEASSNAYTAALIDGEGNCCATGQFRLNPTATPPRFRGDKTLTKSHQAPAATLENMQHLQSRGMLALAIRWDDRHKMAYYLKNESEMAELHQPGKQGYAHGAFLLGITNWVLAGNAYMNPWVHLQTSSQFFQAVPYGTRLLAECAITDLFERKGHQFVDVNVNIFTEEDQTAVMSSTLRAIYKMRPAS